LLDFPLLIDIGTNRKYEPAQINSSPIFIGKYKLPIYILLSNPVLKFCFSYPYGSSYGENLAELSPSMKLKIRKLNFWIS